MEEDALQYIREVARQALLGANAKAVVHAFLPNGRQEGDEFAALNPTRADKNIGSFRVNLRTGEWADFATDDKGRDLVSLVAYLKFQGEEHAQIKAANDIAAFMGWRPSRKPQAAREEEWTPENTPHWIYRDSSHQPYAVVYRKPNQFNKGKKVRRIKQYNPRAGKWKQSPAPIPLYSGPDRCRITDASDPQTVFVVVEGEKARDAAQVMLDSTQEANSTPAIAVCWNGGSSAKAIDRAEWRLLSGRRAVLIPDDDEVGRKAMAMVARKLQMVGAGFIAIADFCKTEGEEEGAKGGDLADPLYAADPNFNLRQTIRACGDANVEPFIEKWHDWSPKKNKSDPYDEEPPPVDGIDYDETLDPWRPLGITMENGKAVYHLLSVRDERNKMMGTGNVHSMRAKTLAQDELTDVAPYSYWFNRYKMRIGNRDGVPWGKITQSIKEMCKDLGIINLDRMIRGPGVWARKMHDEKGNRLPDRYFIHAGESVFDGKEWKATDSASTRDQLFVNTDPIRIGEEQKEDADTLDNAAAYLDICSQLPFHHPLVGELVGAWTILAPFSGALEFRPHLFLIGASDSGKSSLVTHIIAAMASPWVDSLMGRTTEYALRERMKESARPIIIDEADRKSGERQQAEAQNILHLLRATTGSEDNAVIVTGTGTYRPRSMVCMAAVNPALTDAADKNRFVIAQLVYDSRVDASDRLIQWNEKLDRLREIGLEDGDLSRQCFWLVYRNLGLLIGKGGILDMVKRELSKQMAFFSARDLNRLSPLLAIIAFIRSRGTANDEDSIEEAIREMQHGLKSMSDMDENESRAKKRPNELIDMLAGLPVMDLATRQHFSLSTLALRAMDEIEGTAGQAYAQESMGYSYNQGSDSGAGRTANESLEQYGIRVYRERDTGEFHIFFQYNSQRIEEALQRTRWRGGAWESAIKNLDIGLGVVQKKALKVAHRQAYGCAIPLHHIVSTEEE